MFQKKVLKEVLKIPRGRTVTYGKIAKKLHTSPRAVGQALKHNPLPKIIPCYRVVGKKEIGGYFGNSEKMKRIKRKMLRKEGIKYY